MAGLRRDYTVPYSGDNFRVTWQFLIIQIYTYVHTYKELLWYPYKTLFSVYKYNRYLFQIGLQAFVNRLPLFNIVIYCTVFNQRVSFEILHETMDVFGREQSTKVLHTHVLDEFHPLQASWVCPKSRNVPGYVLKPCCTIRSFGLNTTPWCNTVSRSFFLRVRIELSALHAQGNPQSTPTLGISTEYSDSHWKQQKCILGPYWPNDN